MRLYYFNEIYKKIDCERERGYKRIHDRADYQNVSILKPNLYDYEKGCAHAAGKR